VVNRQFGFIKPCVIGTHDDTSPTAYRSARTAATARGKAVTS
jgi:hypothetical protein